MCITTTYFLSFQCSVTNRFSIMVVTTRSSFKSQSRTEYTAQPCAFCNMVFDSARGLSVHMTRAHPTVLKKGNGNDSLVNSRSTKKRKITEEQDVLDNNKEVVAVILEDLSHNATDYGLLNQFEDVKVQSVPMTHLHSHRNK